MKTLTRFRNWLDDRGLLGGGMSRADRARWAACRNATDVGNLMADWLECRIASQPGYSGPCDVDEDDVPGMATVLADLCRAGYVTTSSQAASDGPGYDGARWVQRAAVVGFADAGVWSLLDEMVAGTPGLALYMCSTVSEWGACPVTWRDDEVYTDFGRAVPASDLRDEWAGFGICQRSAVDELAGMSQVAVYDVEPGRNDRLWPALTAMTDEVLT